MNEQNRNPDLVEGTENRRGSIYKRFWGMLLIVAVLTTSLVTVIPAQDVFAAADEPDAADAPDVLWTIHTVDGPPLFYNMTDRYLRYRPDGVPCMAYGGDHLYYACYNKTTLSWDETLVDGNYLVGSYAALAYSSLGYPFITYYDGYQGYLKMAYKIGANPWTTMVMDTGVMAVNRTREDQSISPELQKLFDSIDLRPWRDTLLFSDVLANMPEYDEGPMGVGKYSSLTFDSDGNLHISYHDEINGRLKYIYWDGFFPMVEYVVDEYYDEGDTGLYTSIATVREFDRQWVYISYMNEKYDDVRLARRRGPTDKWRFWTIDGPANVGTFSSLVLDSNNRPNISYLDFTNYNLKVARLEADNETVSKVVVDGQSSDVGLFCSLAIDGNDDLYVSYYDLGNGDLKYAKYDASKNSWSVKRIYNEGNLGTFTSIAVHPTGGTAGKLGIAFFNVSVGALQFTYLTSDNVTWSGSTVQYASDVGQATSLAINSVGVPFISYMNDTNDRLKFTQYMGTYWYKTYVTPIVPAGPYSAIDLRSEYDPVIAFYEQNANDLWVADRFLGPWVYKQVAHNRDVGQHVSMAIDSTGYPRMSYFDATLGELIYAYWDIGSTKWMTDTVDYVDGVVGMYTSLVLDPADQPYISYYDYTHERVKLALKSFMGSWVKLTVAQVGDPEDNVQVMEAYSAVGIDNALVPHVAYYNDTTGDLMFADWNGMGFTITPLDIVGVVGKYVNMVIDPLTQVRHLCYYDETNGNLKYIYWNTVWSLPEDVDVLGNVGLFCDIDIDGAGNPGISYYDASLGDLKYAYGPALPVPFPYSLFVPFLRK